MIYDESFFARTQAGAEASARVVVPLVLPLGSPRSVIDVGCGSGAWLAAFCNHGISDIAGVDGSAAAGTSLAGVGRIRIVDLNEPVDLGRRFDLAVCLEVAEHLTPEAGPVLVASLVRLAPVVLFSAAIPGQGGQSHVNEQWPSHWAALFARHGYLPIDAIRRHVWSDPDVAYWYAQNTLLYAGDEGLATWPGLRAELARTATSQLDIVHPVRYAEWVEWGTYGAFGDAAPER